MASRLEQVERPLRPRLPLILTLPLSLGLFLEPEREPGPEREPEQEQVGSWFFERNTWTEHNLGIPSRSREVVAETDAVVGCSYHFECDSTGSVSPLGRGIRLRNRFQLAAPVGGLRWGLQSEGPGRSGKSAARQPR